MFASKRVRWTADLAAGALAAASTAAVAVASSPTAAVTGCTTVGAVGTSSASVLVPATKVASRYVVTATADNVANQPYLQAVTPSRPLAIDLSNAMNPASFNNNALGGVIDLWDSVTHVTTGLPKSTLTATATDPGGLVRVSVWTCPA
jgi:hypothetical protein